MICSGLMYSSAIRSCSFRGMWFHMPFFGLKADDDVLPDGEVPDDALNLPVLGQKAILWCMASRGVEMDFPAVHPQCALFGLGHAGQKLCRFRAA